MSAIPQAQRKSRKFSDKGKLERIGIEEKHVKVISPAAHKYAYYQEIKESETETIGKFGNENKISAQQSA